MRIWEPIADWWEHRSQAGFAKRTTMYNPANNGVSITVEYKEFGKKPERIDAGENLPDDIRLCRATNRQVVEVTDARREAIEFILRSIQIFSPHKAEYYMPIDKGKYVVALETLREMLREMEATGES